MSNAAAVEALLFDALARPTEAERIAFLDSACGGDAELRRQVEKLLRAQANVGDFLQKPAVAQLAAQVSRAGAEGAATLDPVDAHRQVRDHADPTAHVGAILAGKYKLIEAIGEGGMGTVFMAQQTEPVKRAVAVKVIKQGMDSRMVLARFEAERQALALMDHPNIARVLDAGTTAGGRPFFVMELVKGTPITQFCDQRKLTPRQRLELFVPVCQAIQHAHQKGIIHRDIKPSNVIVALYDERAVPKIIDFGVAKAAGEPLTDQTLMTGFGAMVGTPEYMSPEQASLNNLDVDTRSDVYSLGVLLYELLTGTTPVDRNSLGKAALLEVLRVVREVEAPRPSAKLSSSANLPSVAANRATEPAKLSRLMKGELDWVLLKALEKDRTRRYETANGLARDVQRYLADEIVEARPPSAGYRLKKFVRRHRGQVLAACLVLLALLAGMAGTTWGLIEASDNAKKAETEAGLARKAEREASDRATAEAAAKALARKETKRAEAEWKRAEVELTRAEWLVYVGKLSLAQADFETGNGALAQQYLDSCQEKLRGWEHRYLSSRSSAKLTLRGHDATVIGVAYSPDGTRIVSASQDRTARVWDAQAGKEVVALKGHKGEVSCVAYSPDGTRIVTGSDDKTARVWDAATGQEVRSLEGHTHTVTSVAFSPDGNHILTGAFDSTARVWDAATGQEVHTLKGLRWGRNSVAYSPDGKRILSSNWGQTAKVWDAATGKEVLVLTGHAQDVTSVAYSPDGTRILTGSMDKTARVWDAATGKEILTLQADSGWVNCVAYSPDGKRIASGGRDSAVKVWDAVTGQEVHALKGHALSAEVRGVAFSPDGNRIVSGSGDKTVRVWDAVKGQKVPTLKGHKAAVTSVAFSHDGKRIVTGSGSNDATAKTWDTATGQELLVLEGHKAAVTSVAFSRDGKRIVTGSNDATARVWDAATGEELLVLKGHTGRVTSVAFSPDGTRILSGGGAWMARGEAKVWDAATGNEVLALDGHTNSVTSVGFSPDGKRLLTASGDSTAKVWDAATGKEIFSLEETSWVFGAAFSPDGKRIVTASFHSKTATVWDAATGKEVLVLKGHAGYVQHVAFSPDGKRIVTSGWEPAVRVWDADSGQEVFALKGDTVGVNAFAYSPDGISLITFGNDGAKVWSAEPVQAAWPLPEAAERTAYHTEQADLAEQQKQWFAAEFHLRRVLRDDPENAAVKTRLAEVVKAKAQ